MKNDSKNMETNCPKLNCYKSLKSIKDVKLRHVRIGFHGTAKHDHYWLLSSRK